MLPVTEYPYPVLVVGNVTVGGTGKTPMAIWLAKFLAGAGLVPGVVSRGYGRSSEKTCLVHPDSDPRDVGDEPLVIARRTLAPVAVARRRVDAIDLLLAETSCNAFVSDDGLQHLALGHDISIAMVDSADGMGNSMCLPAGPLRERKGALERAHFRLSYESSEASVYRVAPALSVATSVKERTRQRGLAAFRDTPVNAVAGIRNPQRFFKALGDAGLEHADYPFKDHHQFVQSDFDDFDDPDVPLLMTEKDAVKCERFARPNWWSASLDVEPDGEFVDALRKRLDACLAASSAIS